MDEKAVGLILRLRSLSDSSLLIHWLTADRGRLATAAKGAKRAKSPFRGKLDLLFEANFSFRRSRHSDIHVLTEVALRDTHAVMRKDIVRLRLMAYATRFIEQATEPESPIAGIHAILTTLLAHLANAPCRPALVYALEMKLLNELGLSPPLNESRLNDSTIELLGQLSVLGWVEITHLSPTNAQVRAMKEYLHGFLIYHLGRLPKGRDALLAG